MLRAQFPRFLVAGGIAAVANVVSRYRLPGLGWSLYPETVAHIAGVIVPVFTSYLGHRYLTFATVRPSP